MIFGVTLKGAILDAHMPLDEWSQLPAMKADQRGRCDRDGLDDAAPFDREVPGLSDRHPWPVQEMDDLVTVGVRHEGLQFTGQHHKDLVGCVAEMEDELASHQPAGRHHRGERLKLFKRQTLEQIRPGQTRQNVVALMHGHQCPIEVSRGGEVTLVG